ncbi:TetR/AcrR family transcriptional regulator [Streptomyces sp. JUS-F4]|uniref:ScbR family autoregulator-binding transcription factor n=1 Tax=Streptomyces TaxID=1883 RepID=UPI0018744A28|nr:MULTISPECIES: ScbR family autoregulator-binding transcription factor [Streptomyces]MDX2669827.1 ScbR family autoregulator-binding transcription factor [Streptomyces sp. NRRL_ISP-5395]WKN16485.1 TetR/AcrR family transcriptional regulator [Streptomyces sp. JUS-F4]GHF69715.1 TetR family transcriptional regulator [Streptomyces griseus]
MVQQERGRKSRRSILEAAAWVFDERGYDAASTNEILARTGLTRGSLYHHFPSKEALALALLDAHAEALEVPDRLVKLQAVIDLTLEFARRLQHDPVLRASVRLTVEQTSFSAKSGAYDQSSTAILELLRQAEGRGEILPGVDVREAASTIVGAFTGIQIISQAYSNREDLPERVGVFWRFLLPGLAIPGLMGRLRTTPPPAEAEG